MSEYQAAMESLMTRSIVTLALIYLSVLLFIAAVWIVPRCILKKKRKKKSVADTKKYLSGQIVLTLIVLLPALLTIPEISNIKAMKKDIDTRSYATYTGSYEIAYEYHSKISELWLDVRLVYLEDRDEWLYLDMSGVWEGWAADSGTYNGRLVYGENSGYIVEIKGNK